MSNSRPMWYCHNCSAEIRPLMVPDPECPRCHETFVERLDNPQDDPRNFHAAGSDDDMNLSGLLAHFNEVLRATTTGGPLASSRRGASPERTRNENPLFRGPPSSPSRMVRLEMSGPTGRRTFVLGGMNTLGGQNSEGELIGMPGAFGSSSSNPSSPRLAGLGRSISTDSDSPTNENRIPGNLMANYLLALLGGGPFGMRENPLFGFPTGNSLDPHDGRLGDYVFTQEALDQLLTQMMENANSHRPVPATEEIITNLPRETTKPDTPLLEKDCAVCKEQFSLTPEDPKDKTIVTLPCHHPFHENCIVPWLRSSGTCPVCRYALITQPNCNNAGPGPSGPSRQDHNPPPPAPPSGGGGSGSPPGSGESRTGGSGHFSNFLSNIFHPRGHGSQPSGGGASESHSHDHRHRGERQNMHSVQPEREYFDWRQISSRDRRNERLRVSSDIRTRSAAEREQFGNTDDFFH